MSASIDSETQLATFAGALPAFNDQYTYKARSRQTQLTKPPGSLGRLEELAVWLCGWQATERPCTDRVLTLIFAGNHGVVARGVSAYPPEVTAQMVGNFQNGGAAVNQLCRLVGSELRVIPLSLDKPTADFTLQPAMSMEEVLEAFNAGFTAITDTDLLIIGEMGIGNTTSSAAIAASLVGGEVGQWVGRGTGLDEKGVILKQKIVEAGLALHRGHCQTTLELLRRLGGREHAAMAGAIARARQMRIPVVLDGYVVTSAAATLTLATTNFLDHCIAGHSSAEPGHIHLLNYLGKEPLLNLGMRLGEGSGALVALAVIRAAVATHNGMATFAEASVSSK